MLFSVLFFPTLDIFGKEVFICWAEENNSYDGNVQVLDVWDSQWWHILEKKANSKTTSVAAEKLTNSWSQITEIWKACYTVSIKSYKEVTQEKDENKIIKWMALDNKVTNIDY